ncbi:hypothetical protein EDD21DRAFT_392329 [Dissophora ornata]|nr:hypothetical protein BGZ58_001548 [Dissophora ornata]KAI8595004.1 hypothetical protein EDD21DRAFT_392329 [Dissophora ornata]
MTSTAAFYNKLTILEESSRRLATTDFTVPRLYSALLLENQAVPVRDAKPFEQNLFAANGLEPLINIKAREGADEFEATMELASAFNEICQNPDAEARLRQINSAHGDVLSSIAKLTTQLAELEESNSASETQEPVREVHDEVMTDIIREEGEIFALEQLLSEKRQLVNRMQQELDGLMNLPESELMEQDTTVVEEDPELEAETTRKKLEIVYLDQRIQEHRQQEEEQNAVYESLLRENEELEAQQQNVETNTEEDSSPSFDEIVRLWNRVEEQHGDTTIEPKSIKEAYLKLERLLDNLERCQHHIVNLDVLQQISSTLIDNCAEPTAPEFDPPRTHTVILKARALQLIVETGGSIPLQDLKDQISKEAVEQGATQELGVQAVYSLVASYLIRIDRTTKSSIVSFA